MIACGMVMIMAMLIGSANYCDNACDAGHGVGHDDDGDGCDGSHGDEWIPPTSLDPVNPLC